MAASIWTKALGVREPSLLLRAARCVRSSAHNVTHSAPCTAGRRSVASAYQPVVPEDETQSLDRGAPAKPMDVSPEEPNADQPLFTTLERRISHNTLKAITVSPFKMKHMTSVQAAVLPLLPQLAAPWLSVKATPESERTARDLLVKARTGTGKTLAFLVPAIESRLKAIDANGKQAVIDAGLTTDKSLQGRAKRIYTRETVGTLIISPTRELATQIANEALRLSHHQDGFEVRLFTGGNSKKMQMRDWMRGRRDIVVATPGRLRDLLTSEPAVAQGLATTQTLILDEADTLLDMGFKEDIDAITEFLPPSPERQTFLFSATVSNEIKQIARRTLAKNHVFINCVEDNAPPVHAHIPQYHTVLPNAGSQIPHVLRLIAHDQLTNPGRSKIIVFLPTTKMTQLFSTFIRQLGRHTLPTGRSTNIYEMHSKRQQSTRDNVSDTFRRDQTGSAILISSDVSARGIDYPGVTRIIQVGIPSSTDQYIHRVGRTGRGASVSGRADLVLLPWEIGFVSWLLTDIPLKPLTINELKNQVNELAQKFDENPLAYLESARLPAVNRRAADWERPAEFVRPYSPVLEEMPKAISNLCSSLEEDAVKETMFSLLGYYLSKSAELRVQKSVIVQGCKDWTMEVCELPMPPYVSDSFLAKLGVSPSRARSADPYKERRGNQPSWMGRGSVRKRMQNEHQHGRDQPHGYGHGRDQPHGYGHGRDQPHGYGVRQQPYDREDEEVERYKTEGYRHPSKNSRY